MTVLTDENTIYLIPEGEPFRGVASLLLPDGTVAWTDGLTLAQYETERGKKMRKVTPKELDALVEEDVRRLTTAPTRETEEAWDYALDVLPPSRFGHVGGATIFHICERIQYDLVAWHIKLSDGRCFTCNAPSSADRGALIAAAIAAEPAP